MKVLEVKNNLVKVAFDTDDNLALGSFLVIEDTNNPYVAQIMNLKSDSTSNFAIVKLLFTFNEEGILKNYNGTIPSKNATISTLPSNELLDIIPAESPLIIGSLAQQDINLKVDKTILENNLLICSNKLQNTTELLSNIIKQVDEKSIIIDTEGQFEWDNAIKISKDFKLPLNYDAINFIYDNELEDIEPISKAMIQDIFIEVQEYIQTLPERFLPFETFINVIDSQYKETQIPQLILLKNKLLKYKEMNIFAQTLKDILDLRIALDSAQNISIDLSDIPENLQKEVIRYIYTILNGINQQIYCFVKVNNSNISKKLLKRYIARDNVYTTVICPHEFKYIEEIKEASQNIIFFAPLTLQHDFASYNSFLSKLNEDEFVIYGAHTQNIPLITEITPVEETDEALIPENKTTEDVFENTQDEITIQKDFREITYPSVEDIETSVTDTNDEQIIIEEPIIQEPAVSETKSFEQNEIQPVENILDDSVIYEPIDEQPSFENDENFEIYSNSENEYQQELSGDEVIERVAKDVDKVFYEKIPTEDDEFDTQEELTEADLNLIDDLSINEEISLVGDEEISEFDNYEDDLPPVVPIYPADTDLENEIQSFEAGERVSTAKYGEGIVKKMIKYGNKILCSIDFPNIGIRLLDPSITEITRLS